MKYERTSTDKLLSMVSELQSEIEKRRVICPNDIIRRLQRFRNLKQETFFVATLNGNHAIIDIHEVTKGLVNRTVVHPREVFAPAIVDNAVAIIIGHNHPSGSLELSDDDTGVIKRLSESGEILGIRVLDHILVSPVGTSSALESGDMT